MTPESRRPLLLALFEAAAGGRFAPSLPILESEVDWAIQTGMGPLLHAALERAPAATHGDLVMRVRAADRLARIECSERLDATAEILDGCGDRAGPITLLKGISICTQHHARPHDRAMGDLDLLVEPEGVQAIESTLAALGYRPVAGTAGRDYSRHHHTRPLLHPRTGVCVEVHTGLFSEKSGWAKRPPFAMNSVRNERRSGSFAGRSVYRLSDELQLVYIAAHAALVLDPAAGARALLDALLLLRQAGDRLDWERLGSWLDDPRIAARLQLILGYLARQGLLTDRTGPASIAHRLRVLRRGEWRVLAGIVHRHYVRGARLNDRFGANNRDILWRTLLTTPGSNWNYVRVPWNLLFPPSRPDRFRLRHQLERLRSALGFED